MKILILRFSSIGDIVLTTPVIRNLRKKFPEAQIHYATKRGFSSILQHNPYINKIHLLNDSVFELIKELKAEKFDRIIDLHHNQRTLLIKMTLGVKANSFNKLNFQKWMLVHFKINRLPAVHIVDRYIAACSDLGVENDGEGLDYFISKDDEVDLKTLDFPVAEPYIAWVIGGNYHTKKFPIGKAVTAISKIKYPVILLGGMEDVAAGEEIVRSAVGAKVFNACGKFNLSQSASLVRQARLVISNDTGLMHIAAAFKKTMISIWGNTIPAFGMYPYYGKYPITNTILEVDKLSCRPCSKLGYHKCPQGHFNCMNLLEVNSMVRIINQYMPQ